MTGYTDQQQGYIALLAAAFSAVATAYTGLTSTQQGALPSWVPFACITAGFLAHSLMQFKGSTPQQQQDTLDSLKEFAQIYMATPEAQRPAMLANLPILLPLLTTPAAPAPAAKTP